jgi:hypothetical protein
MNIRRFDKLASLPNDFRQTDIKPSVTIPTFSNYEDGYVVRYFAQKINDEGSPVFEIDRKTFSGLSNNVFFRVVDLDWVLKGEERDVKEMNFKSVKYASQKLPAIQLYLPNFLQFYKTNLEM